KTAKATTTSQSAASTSRNDDGRSRPNFHSRSRAAVPCKTDLGISSQSPYGRRINGSAIVCYSSGHRYENSWPLLLGSALSEKETVATGILLPVHCPKTTFLDTQDRGMRDKAGL